MDNSSKRYIYWALGYSLLLEGVVYSYTKSACSDFLHSQGSLLSPL